MILFHEIFVTLQKCFRMKSRHLVDDATDSQDIFAQILSPNQHLEREPMGKNHVTIGAAHSSGFIHKLHGVVLNLVRDMAVVCAFSMFRDKC